LSIREERFKHSVAGATKVYESKRVSVLWIKYIIIQENRLGNFFDAVRTIVYRRFRGYTPDA